MEKQKILQNISAAVLVGRRLRQVRAEFGMKRQADMGGFLQGIPQTTISNAEAGRNLPSPQLLAALVQWAGVNLNWLFTGEGEMFVSRVPLVAYQVGVSGQARHNPEYNKAVKAIVAERKAKRRTIHEQRAATDLPGGFDVSTDPIYGVSQIVQAGYEETDQPGPNRVPILGRIAAGKGISTEEADQYALGAAATFLIYKGTRRLPPDAWAVKIDGESMMPDFAPRDVVIADPVKRTTAARPAVVKYLDESGEVVATLKDLSREGGKFVLASRQKGYKDIVLTPSRFKEAFEVFEIIRFLKKGE